jgi:hypothetical protein
MFELDEGRLREPPLSRAERRAVEILDHADAAGYCPAGDYLVDEAAVIGFGPDTLPRLLAVPFHDLSDAGRSHALETLTRFAGYVDGLITELTGIIAGPTPATEEQRRDDFSSHEISVATRCSVHVADAKINFARDLSERLQATADALAAGRITERQARALSEATCHLDVATVREGQAHRCRDMDEPDIGPAPQD